MFSRRVLLHGSLLFLTVVLLSCRPVAEPLGSAPDASQSTPIQPLAAAYDCSAVADIPVAECQALLSFYEATNGPAWSSDGTPWEEGDTAWLQGESPCRWVGVSCDGGHVTGLALYYNDLQGQLPPQLSQLSALRLLDLHNNQLGGEIPAELGNLSNLQSLDLSANQLSGSLPASLGQLRQLTRIDLPHNQLTGTIPDTWGALSALHTLDLAYNRLDGEMPAAVAGLSSLQTLRLNDNQLQGAIPEGLGQLPQLTEVNLAFNRLSGPVPAGLEPDVSRVLWGNQLQGSVEVTPGQPLSAAGVTLTGDRSLAVSVWPETLPAVMPGPDAPWWAGRPAHTRLTLVREGGSTAHAPMGINVPAEAQIHVYPVAGFEAVSADPAWQEQLAALQDLLAQGSGPTDDTLPLLPPTNGAQMFHAQPAVLDFQNGQGIRYLTQYVQGPTPVANDQLFYTFQGLTADGSAYVAAFFPVSAPGLPDSVVKAPMNPEMAAYFAGADTGYLDEAVQALNALPADAFTPAFTRIDGLIASLSVALPEPPAALQGGWPPEGEAVDGEPILQWGPFAGATAYELVVVDDDAYPPVVAFSYTGAETVVPVAPALTPGSYSWTVRALDGSGNTLAELNRQFTAYASLDLVQPADLEEVGPTPTLEWQPVAGAASYDVSVVTGYPPEVVFSATTTEPRVTVTPPLSAADVHYWTIWARDENGQVLAALSSSFAVVP